MHELSIVMSIVDLANKEATKHQASAIEEIELDIGCLSGIDMDSFDFAWQSVFLAAGPIYGDTDSGLYTRCNG